MVSSLRPHYGEAVAISPVALGPAEPHGGARSRACSVPPSPHGGRILPGPPEPTSSSAGPSLRMVKGHQQAESIFPCLPGEWRHKTCRCR